MTVKISFLFNGTIGTVVNNGVAASRRPFGFSESWYAPDNMATDRELQIVGGRRVLSMAGAIGVYGYRISPALSGKSRIAFPIQQNNGIPGTACNVPADSAYCKVNGTAASGPIKRFWMHGLPDEWVYDGALIDGGGSSAAQKRDYLRFFLGQLVASGYFFKYLRPASDKVRIISISGTGLVTLDKPLSTAVAANGTIQLMSVRDTQGRRRSGYYTCPAGAAGSTVQINRWPAGSEVSLSGFARNTVPDFTTFTVPDDFLIRLGTRKVGRPFGALRGRSSARR